MAGISNQTKLRRAEKIVPPNVLKKKVGHGGFDKKKIEKAQDLIEHNDIDFTPIAQELLDELQTIITEIETGKVEGERAIEKLFFPAMQLRAQGGMFQYPLVSKICDVLINFMETVEKPDSDAMEIVMAHHRTLTAILAKDMKGKNFAGGAGGDLCKALSDACARYHKKHVASQKNETSLK
ncbi:MAG: hypothetical protein HND56_02030 [Pseudomonadota bacterium]|nr:hypothetical protein [Pseudomonadota bacterium]QKK04540.1 MAG: hypothetical protein HND56_02030 [Pseudomonadota bacterium]